MTDEILGPETVISLDGQSARSPLGVNDQVEDEHWTKCLAWSRRIKRLIFGPTNHEPKTKRSGRRSERVLMLNEVFQSMILSNALIPAIRIPLT